MTLENWELVTKHNLEGNYYPEYEIGQEIFYTKDGKEFSLWSVNNLSSGETFGGFDTCEECVMFLLKDVRIQE